MHRLQRNEEHEGNENKLWQELWDIGFDGTLSDTLIFRSDSSVKRVDLKKVDQM